MCPRLSNFVEGLFAICSFVTINVLFRQREGEFFQCYLRKPQYLYAILTVESD